MIVILDFSGDFDFDKINNNNIEWIEQFQTTAIKQFCYVLKTLQLG